MQYLFSSALAQVGNLCIGNIHDVYIYEVEIHNTVANFNFTYRGDPPLEIRRCSGDRIQFNILSEKEAKFYLIETYGIFVNIETSNGPHGFQSRIKMQCVKHPEWTGIQSIKINELTIQQYIRGQISMTASNLINIDLLPPDALNNVLTSPNKGGSITKPIEKKKKEPVPIEKYERNIII